MIFLDRDNEVRFRLKQNGRDVKEDAVTRVTLWLPAAASSETDEPIVFDTDTSPSEIYLNADATEVTLFLGHSPVNSGAFVGYITVYDPNHPNGLAWAKETIRIKDWPS